MESKNYKIVNNFITDHEVILIKEWVESLNHKGDNCNDHLRDLSKVLNGNSYIFNISKTNETNYISNFQSISDVSNDKIPYFIENIINRIAEINNLPTNHIFLQAVDMNKGGLIKKHYDASIEGFINYKCNISVISEDYQFFIDKQKIDVKEKDLYCFEASLYKHWTNEFNSRRVFLSIGFIVPYKSLNRDESDVRVRLSNRIEKYFQKN